jgi:hypothetical protein
MLLISVLNSIGEKDDQHARSDQACALASFQMGLNVGPSPILPTSASMSLDACASASPI